MAGREVRFGKRRSGQALLEATLMAPMLFFVFLGMMNFGFFVYAFIQVGNAARIAAQATAAPGVFDNAFWACDAALKELRTMPNLPPASACGACSGNPPTNCSVTVGAEKILEVKTDPTYTGTPTQNTWVELSYLTIKMFPLPFMTGQMTINRHAVMRVISSS